MNYVKADLIYLGCDHHARRTLSIWSI